MKSFCRLVMIATCALLLAAPALAETRYVGDQLVITVREQPDDAAPRIKNIVTDTPFEVLAESGEFLQVRLADGTEGYVKSRYTSTDTPKPVQIERLQAAQAKLQQEYDELKASLGAKQSSGLDRQKQLQAECDSLKQQIKEQAAAGQRLQADRDRIEHELAELKKASGNVVEIVGQAETLRADNERMSIELESLQGENAMLLRTAAIKWVLTGAGVLFLGWIMGKASRSKKRRY